MCGWPRLRVHPNSEAWPFKLLLGAAFDFFHHKPSAKIIDYQPAARDNTDSDWGSFEGRPSTKTALETAPKPFQRSLTS